MASNLFSIGSSGVKAARTALEVTAQNIANAATEGYVRRGISLTEMASPASQTRLGDYSFSGVRVSGVSRAADQFRQTEVRRTSSDAARAGAELAGLENRSRPSRWCNFGCGRGPSSGGFGGDV